MWKINVPWQRCLFFCAHAQVALLHHDIHAPYLTYIVVLCKQVPFPAFNSDQAYYGAYMPIIKLLNFGAIWRDITSRWVNSEILKATKKSLWSKYTKSHKKNRFRAVFDLSRDRKQYRRLISIPVCNCSIGKNNAGNVPTVSVTTKVWMNHLQHVG